jgi:alpha-L-fucosidase
MTLNGHWGYKKGDENWKPTERLVQTLIDIASKGGNFLLNVGPTGEGIIPGPSVARLGEVGKWMQVNGESIYGTTPSPLKTIPVWGRVTKKVTPDGTALYLHIFNWPADGKLLVPGLHNEIESATVLASGEPRQATTGAEGVMVSLPTKAPDSIASVVVLKFKGR